MIVHLASLIHAAATTTTTVAHKSTGGSILDPIAKPLAWVLAGIYSVIPNYGVAIMGLSLLWMVIIAPLTLKSTRSMLAMQRLQPELKRLQAQHKDDRQAFAQAQMELFREHNVSPFGSCLPMLLPLPVFFALFRVIEGLSHTVTVAGQKVAEPKYLSAHTQMYKAIQKAGGHLHAFGMDLSQNPLSPHSGVLAAAPYWIVLLIMAGTSYFQSAQMMSRNPAAMQNNPQAKMMKYLPLIFVVFCIRFPAGVIVYYVMSNLCRITQQDLMYRFDPRVKSLVAREVVEVEEITHEIDEGKRRGPGYTPPRGAKAAIDTTSSAKGRPAASTPASGRSRFRDLLAQAAEQQKAQQDAKAAAAKGGAGAKAAAAPRAGTARNGTNGTKAGAPAANGGARPAGNANRPPAAAKSRSGSGSRTNRKKRGR